MVLTKAGSFRDNLGLLFRARFPVLYVESFEESRVIEEIRVTASDEGRMRTVRPVWVWAETTGWLGPDGQAQSNTDEPNRALMWVMKQENPGVYIMLDLHLHMGDEHRPANPAITRKIRDIAAAFQRGNIARALILVSPVLRIPVELEKDITLVDFALPGEDEIRGVLEDMIATNTANGGRIRVEVDGVGRERIAKAALGLTLNEATNAFARAMVNDGVLSHDDVQIVLEEKRQTIRKSGLLEFVAVDIDLEDVGGLQNLKRWLTKRNNSWMADAAAYGLPAPKGVLMTGVPGCGKSLTAKAVAAAWELPLLRLDIGRVFSGLVGSSEQNMRRAIKAAEATAPCVLWIDEIEKGFSGISGAGDSGTSSRVFGSFLTWMQEKSSTVFVIATANNVDRLPPEFLRKGRFDEIFFVDLPTRTEREDIWGLHLSKRLRNRVAAGNFQISNLLLQRLAEASEGYSGAEIEQAVIAGLFDAYAERRPLEEQDLFRTLRNMVPLSVTQAEQVSAVRSWAASRAIAATAKEDRAGYELMIAQTVGPDYSSSAVPPRDSDGPARGGRVVDF